MDQRRINPRADFTANQNDSLNTYYAKDSSWLTKINEKRALRKAREEEEKWIWIHDQIVHGAVMMYSFDNNQQAAGEWRRKYWPKMTPLECDKSTCLSLLRLLTPDERSEVASFWMYQ